MDLAWRLQQPKQCQGCPWRADTSVKDIPNYDPKQHQSLSGTIADSQAAAFRQELQIMACHASTNKQPLECIGWLEHQLINNNIALRLRMRHCENFNELETVGLQVETFEDTFK